MEKLPKVLVGCPTFDGQKFCFEEFDKCIKSLTYTNFDIFFVDNSKDTKYTEFLKEKGYDAVHIIPEAKDRIGIIVESRNAIIKKAIDEKYDHLLFLDTDIICPSDTIQKLVSYDKPIISGICLMLKLVKGVKKIYPALLGFSGKKEYAKKITVQDVMDSKLMEVYAAGFGCILIKRDVLEKVKLRYNPEMNSGEDFIFCYDAREKFGYQTFVDTSIKCAHISKGRTFDFELVKKLMK